MRSAAEPVGLLEGIATTRAIRRYHDEPVPDEVLRDIFFAATRAPSGSNRQPFRFVVLADPDAAGPEAEVRRLLADNARRAWGHKRVGDSYDRGSGAEASSPKARMARTMEEYVEGFARIPVIVLACLARYRPANPGEGSSLYPAVQNLLLAARALGYGGALTGFQAGVEGPIAAALGIPEGVAIHATVTLGRPRGSHGPVRRRPMAEAVHGPVWGQAPAWAVDPPGTRHTAAGPPPSAGGAPPRPTR